MLCQCSTQRYHCSETPGTVPVCIRAAATSFVPYQFAASVRSNLFDPPTRPLLPHLTPQPPLNSPIRQFPANGETIG